jgi:hypothetical protein
MKRFFSFLIIIFLNLNVIAQTPLDAVIQGTIFNAIQKEITLKYLNNPLDDSLSSIKIDLNERGQFYQELPITRPLDLFVCYADKTVPLYIEPSERVEFTANSSNIQKTMHFIGSNNNSYLMEYMLKFEQQKITKERNAHALKDNPDTYKLYEDNLAKAKLNFLEKFDSKQKLSAKFLKRQKAAILYEAANNKFEYAQNYYKIDSTRKPLPKTYYQFVDSLSVNENDLISVPEFYEYLEHRFQYEYSIKPYTETSESQRVSYTFSIVFTMYSDRVQNIFITKKFGEFLDIYPYSITSRFISTYMSNVYPVEYRRYIDKKIEQAKLREK